MESQTRQWRASRRDSDRSKEKTPVAETETETETGNLYLHLALPAVPLVSFTNFTFTATAMATRFASRPLHDRPRFFFFFFFSLRFASSARSGPDARSRKYKSSCEDRKRRSERFSPTQLNRPRVCLRTRNGPTFEIPLHPLGKMIAYNSLLIIPMNHWLSQFDRLNETAITFVAVFTWARNRYAYRGFIVEGIANFIQRKRRGERLRDIESKCDLRKSYFFAECINSTECLYTKIF